jgi:hypothetical protein
MVVGRAVDNRVWKNVVTELNDRVLGGEVPGCDSHAGSEMRGLLVQNKRHQIASKPVHQQPVVRQEAQ